MSNPQLLERAVRPVSPPSAPGSAADGRLVRAWMSAPAAAGTPSTPIPEAYDLMVQRGIRHLPIVAGARVVGLVTQATLCDLLPHSARLHSDLALRAGMAELQVSLVLAPDPPTVAPGTTMQDAAALMLTHGLDAVLVVGPAGDLLGILTATDLCRMIAAGAAVREAAA